MAPYLCIDCGLHLCIEVYRQGGRSGPSRLILRMYFADLQILKPELLSDH